MTHTDDADAAARTLAAYESGAARWAEVTPWRRSPLLDEVIRLTSPGELILELGSGPGRDADAIESSRRRVHRTDGTTAFVTMQRAAGHDAHVLDVHADDFGGPYDAVFANAVLLHVARARLRSVLEVARRATRAGGVLAVSVKRGTGEEWSHRKLDAPRRFTYWLEGDLEQVVTAAGWTPVRVAESTRPSSPERWIDAIARNDAAG